MLTDFLVLNCLFTPETHPPFLVMIYWFFNTLRNQLVLISDIVLWVFSHLVNVQFSLLVKLLIFVS